ncbi:MAG: prepilin-type N-terminal cleavage/methylation protein [Gammaproteobacteria bacterium]|jgi:prepilin-type N-terminal cleavage/methylation domain-containing protein|nr:prepilin-type N-terminal cleavage/methylation protein [Gammaproteobacteria bacterium]
MRRLSGFTITEMLIVIGLIAIVSAFSTNAIYKILHREIQLSNIEKMSQVILYARNYAISHNKTINLCPSKTHRNCEGNWTDGAILLSNNKEILLSLPKLQTGYHLSLHAFPDSDHLEFNALGMLNSNNGKFIYQLPDGAIETLLISKTGRVRVSNS